MKNTFYTLLMRAGFFAFIVSFFSFISYAQTPPATCTAAIGSPANGASHYLNISWSSVTGATSYDLQYSTDGTIWNNLSSGSNATTYNHNTGAIGNMPFYYRVRTVTGSGQSAWKNCSQYPIYTACDNPSLPLLANASNNSLTVTLIAESPDPNPAYTTYSIYCTTTSQYVQANGSLGVTEVYQTMSVWSTTTVTGLTASTNYCFYAKAKNKDGDVRVATGGTIVAVEPFTTATNFNTTSAAPTNKFWSPSTCTTGGLKYFSTGGCTEGYVGFTGSWNSYFGCFLRTPQWNCTGNSSVIINFDLSNSYIASHIKASPSSSDAIRFYMWVDGGYKAASSVTIGGVEVSSKDGNGTWLKFDAARTCVNVSVTFDLSTSSNLTGILFYLEPNCGYNDSQVFSAGIDNVSLQQSGGTATACLSTTACASVTIQNNPSSKTICAGENTSFSVTTSGEVGSYQWQVSTNNGVSWNIVNNGGVYSSATTATLNISGATAGMSNYQYKCTVTGSCGGTPTSTAATLVVNPVVQPSFSLGSAASPICAGSVVSFNVFDIINGGSNPTYVWKKNGVTVGGNSDTYIDNNIVNGDDVTVAVTSNAPCASPVTVYSAPNPFTVLPKVTPSVSITVPQTNICSGTPLTFTANPVYGGAPSYEWTKNGNNVGSDSKYYSDNSLQNNDIIAVTMTSTAACAQPTIVFSSEITITINAPANAGIISSSGGDTLCSGTPVSISTTGYTGNVQWQSSITVNNFTDIPSAVSPSYIGSIAQTSYFRVIATNGTCTDTSLAKKIIVTPAPEANFDFTLSGRKVTFNSAGTSGDVTAYDWNFDDGSAHSNEVNPVHDYTANGIFHVCLSVKNGSNCSFTICKDVTVSAPTSIRDLSNSAGFRIYPNPVSDNLIIKGSLLNATVTVQNILGQTVLSAIFSNELSATLDLSNLAQGTYLLSVISEEGEFVQRIIKE